MKKMVLAGMVVVAMTGCATMGGLSGGRYYQMVSPLNDTVLLQVDMASERGCNFMVANVDAEYKSFARCSRQSVAETLAWRAVTYNPVLASTFVMDAISEEACQSAIAGMLRTAAEEKSGAKVVMQCTRK
ncbi:hypothetical protein ACG97_05865 [Vogesella sp. EB]|nr:hypothetical protein ACG97_05865 [Vogesella sp. EB]